MTIGHPRGKFMQAFRDMQVEFRTEDREPKSDVPNDN